MEKRLGKAADFRLLRKVDIPSIHGGGAARQNIPAKTGSRSSYEALECTRTLRKSSKASHSGLAGTILGRFSNPFDRTRNNLPVLHASLITARRAAMAASPASINAISPLA